MVIFSVNRDDKGMKGISLVETLVVVVIISIVLKFAISMFNTYKENTNLREAAGALAADMKLAKQRAVAENVNYTITFDVSNNRYEIQGPSGCCSTCTTHCTYDVTRRLSSFGNGISINDNYTGHTITFYTRGTCDLGTVILKNSITKSELDVITNMTGRVKIVKIS